MILYFAFLNLIYSSHSRSQWRRGLRRGSAAPLLLGLWVRITTETWMSVSCECCVLSGRGLCVGLITRPEESYRVWCGETPFDCEASIMRRPWPTGGCWAIKKRYRLKHFMNKKRFILYGPLQYVLCCKAVGREFDSQWCHWNFSLT
jgi:hypothetical protein